MAERKPPGFNVPLGFYDGPEVKSIPRRIRAAAVGVWTLCGTFSANKLQDGYVGSEDLKTLCCTDAIRDALMSTKGPDGELDPLWVSARDGGIQFTKWFKYQRSRAEVKAYRSADAERKRNERKAPKGAANWEGSEMSERTSSGHASDYRDPKTKTETKTEDSSYVQESATDSNGRGSVAATPGAELVREIVPPGHPAATLTALRVRASELIRQNHPRADVAAALQLWCDKPSLGPNALPSLLSEVIKSRAAPNGKPASKMRALAELAAETRAAELQTANGRKELT